LYLFIVTDKHNSRDRPIINNLYLSNKPVNYKHNLRDRSTIDNLYLFIATDKHNLSDRSFINNLYLFNAGFGAPCKMSVYHPHADL
jgi:tyrosine-protein phosphatase YwqE